MVIATRNGFQLSGHLNGTTAPPATRFQKSTDGGQDGIIYVGDPISLTSAGTVLRAHRNDAVDGGRNGSNNPIGVCTGIFETEDGRPLTHRTNKFAVTADAFWIDVITDPDALYEVSFGATANQTAIGAVGGVTYDTAVTAAGISGAGMLSAESQASVANTMFRVVSIVNLQRDGANASNNDQLGRVRVVMANHYWRRLNQGVPADPTN